MIKKSLLAAVLLSTTAVPVLSQPAPFDMTPESGMVVPSAPVKAPETTVPAQTPIVPVAKHTDRYLLPEPSLRLDGEESRQAVVVYLTEAQAAAKARLELSSINAVVVAPEISRLSVRVNGNELSSAPIASSSTPKPISIDVPEGLLKAGANRIEFAATQRHRTDCSISSTYELWTEIGSDTAKLSFEGADLGRLSQLSDLAAIGVDASGQTTIRLIAADLNNPEAIPAAVALAQNLALATRVSSLNFEVATTLSEANEPGVLDVILAPIAQLPTDVSQFRDQASAAPLATFVPRSTGANTLLVSGPDWPSVARASAALLTAAPVSDSRPRVDLPFPIPLLDGAQTISLADLGVSTTEFNGRRLATRFQFELPYDFYANRYGEAELILDAAYSADVQPGSEINIFTNTEIASSTPLLRTDGDSLRNTVIRVPMTNLRPGRNEVDVMVNLRAVSDDVCSPGWSGQAPVRFVFSSESEFRLPNYAHAAALPDLQVMTGSAWPYSNDTTVPLVLGTGQEPALTAMQFMARTAASSGTVTPVSIASEAQLRPDQNAIVVMSMAAMSPPTLSRSGLTRAASGGQAQNDRSVLDQFAGEGSQRNVFSGGAEWALQFVGLTLDDLRFLPRADEPYPVASNAVAIAQSVQPEGGVWTFLTGGDDDAMTDGMKRLSATEQWRQVAGRVSTLGPASDEVTVVRPNSPKLIVTQPFSIWNMRLVAANWFSGNILAFTAALVAASILLMLATALLLKRSGREE